MATNGHVDDPMDVASNATLAPRSYYGQIQIEAWFCILQKGVGKIPYDGGMHNAEDRRTAIDIALLPLAEQNVNFEIKRSTIAESREWAGVIWPSLKSCGITSVREAHEKWACMQQVPSGRKYRNSSGEEKEATTFKFITVYPDEAACRAAYLADTGKADESAPTSSGANGNGSNGNGHNGNGNGANGASHDLQVAIPFIKAFAKQAGFDLEKVKTMCRGQALITKAVDLDSAQFAEIVASAMPGGTDDLPF